MSRKILGSQDIKRILELGKVLSKDFVIVAIVQTLNLMLSGYLSRNDVSSHIPRGINQ